MKATLSMILGILVTLSGLVPLFNTFNIINFSIPHLVSVLIWIIVSFGGLYLVIDAVIGFSETMTMLPWLGLFAGIVISVMGIVPLLMELGLLNYAWLENFFTFASNYVLDYIYIFAGVILLAFGLRFWIMNI